MKKDYDNLYAVRHTHSAGTPVDFDRYTQYVSKLSKQIDSKVVNLDTLEAMLGVAEATGNLLDLYKKTIVYGRADLKTAMLAANTELRRANIVLDDALCLNGNSRDMPQGNKKRLNLRLLHAAIGAFGEWAEILSAIRKSIQTGNLDEVNVVEELGDAGYYDADAHTAIGVPKHISMGRNTAKLDIRFPEGSFSAERVNNRDLAGERRALEGAAPL